MLFRSEVLRHAADEFLGEGTDSPLRAAPGREDRERVLPRHIGLVEDVDRMAALAVAAARHGRYFTRSM